MRKILLILAVVVCVGVAGTALAVGTHNANDVTGTITTDKCFILSFDGSSTDLALTLDETKPEYYTIVCNIDKSATATGTGTLTIALNPSSGKSLANVTVELFTDSNCTTHLQQNAANVSVSGGATSQSVSVTGISAAQTTYYAKITLSPLGETDPATIEGELQLDFVGANVN